MKKVLIVAVVFLAGCSAIPFNPIPVSVDCRVKIGFDKTTETAKYAYCL